MGTGPLIPPFLEHSTPKNDQSLNNYSDYPDEADEATAAAARQCRAPAPPRALPQAHLAHARAGQPQAHGAGHHRLCAEHDAARAARHVQQDRQPGRGPGPAEPRPDEARAGHPPGAGEVSGREGGAIRCGWISVVLFNVCIVVVSWGRNAWRVEEVSGRVVFKTWCWCGYLFLAPCSPF